MIAAKYESDEGVTHVHHSYEDLFDNPESTNHFAGEYLAVLEAAIQEITEMEGDKRQTAYNALIHALSDHLKGWAVDNPVEGSLAWAVLYYFVEDSGEFISDVINKMGNTSGITS